MPPLLALCLAVALLTPAPAVAQVATGTVDSLTASFRSALERARTFVSAREQTSGEDSLVAMLRAEDEVELAAQALHDLAALFPEGQTGALSPEIAAHFRELLGALTAARDRVSASLDQTRQRIFYAEGRDRLRLERELATHERRLSSIERHLQEILDAMHRLRLPVDEDRVRLAAMLLARAESLAGRIRLVDQELEETGRIVAARPDDAEFAQELQLWQGRSELYVQSLQTVVDRLRALGEPTARFQNVLVTHTGQFSRGLLDAEVLRSVAADGWRRTRVWLSENGLHVVVRTLVFLLVMVLAWAVARVVRRAVQRALDGPRVRVSNLLRKMLIDISGNLVLLAGLLLALSQVGTNLAPVLAGVGVVGFIVGFALQDTLANFAAGIMILFYRPYDVGDFVEVAGGFGKVHEMSLVSTTILTVDNQTLVVPNGKIWGDVIRNVTAQTIRRVDLEFGISYSDDIPKAERILTSILEADARVLEEPAPQVRLAKLNESSVDFIVRPWVRTDDYWDVFWDVTRAVKLRFDAEGITIPFPQRDVHHHLPGQDAAAARVPPAGAARPAPAAGIGADEPAAEDPSS